MQTRTTWRAAAFLVLISCGRSSLAAADLPERLPEHHVDVAGGVGYGGAWAELPAGAPTWLYDHELVSGVLEVAAVGSRTFVLRLHGAYGLGNGPAYVCLGPCPAPLQEHRVSIELGLGARVDLYRRHLFAVALELTAGAGETSVLVDVVGVGRDLGTVHGDARVVFELAGGILSVGVRARGGFRDRTGHVDSDLVVMALATAGYEIGL